MLRHSSLELRELSLLMEKAVLGAQQKVRRATGRDQDGEDWLRLAAEAALQLREAAAGKRQAAERLLSATGVLEAACLSGAG